ncbi:flagellar motor protein MotB [Thalassospira xiamenensis]|uniref:OmpA family protein n=1 Tax=Thalassospira xiamenensis TaxID=220697 RepID=UPI000DED7416|nr:OmpA family protein [Thalassospira xiamenensis]RCK33396.1 flagellar motor protein MotB [Thalassospira xiamenensis]
MGVLKSTTWRWSEHGSAKIKLRPLLHAGSALAVVLMLGACSSVPDAINPVEWGKSIGDAFDGEDETAAKSDQPIPGEDEDYPRLADTPAKPVVTGDAERDALVAGLAADRANAQYTQSGRRQSTPPVNALQPEPAPSAANVDQPEITPAPTTAVSSSAMAEPKAQAAEAQSTATEMQKSAETTAKASETKTVAAAGAAGAATGSAVTSAQSGSKIADEWNAKAPTSGPVPTPAPVPEKPEVLEEKAPAAPSSPEMTDEDRAAIAKAEAALVAAEAGNAAFSASSAPASSGDPVMDQYNKRLAEGEGVFANEPTPGSGPAAQAQAFDYSVYSDNGSVIVDESQLGGGGNPYLSDSAMPYAETANEVLAARLGVRSVDTLGPSVNGVQVAQIQFGHGSSNLSGSDNNVLNQVAQAWRQTGGILRIIGHASMRTANMSLEEHMAINRQVSERRASAVVSELVSLGVNPDAIFVGADGSADPRYYEGVPAGEAGNRRVEIFMDY